MATISTVRWIVDVSRWQPSNGELEFICTLIPDLERQDCLRYRQLADKKRAVVSRLLQRQCIAQICHIPWKLVEIRRTKGRKPYSCNSCPIQDVPNFNYNVSHEVWL